MTLKKLVLSLEGVISDSLQACYKTITKVYISVVPIEPFLSPPILNQLNLTQVTYELLLNKPEPMLSLRDFG